MIQLYYIYCASYSYYISSTTLRSSGFRDQRWGHLQMVHSISWPLSSLTVISKNFIPLTCPRATLAPGFTWN